MVKNENARKEQDGNNNRRYSYRNNKYSYRNNNARSVILPWGSDIRYGSVQINHFRKLWNLSETELKGGYFI